MTNVVGALRALRASEIEVADLKDRLNASELRLQASPPPLSAPADALGWVSSIGDAREYLNEWVSALESCQRFADVLANSLEHPAVVNAMLAPRSAARTCGSSSTRRRRPPAAPVTTCE